MYKPTLGLEIHIELNTKTKMFCGCLNDSEEKRPNFNICPICTGHPGTLPVINEEAVKKVIKTGLALNCQIAEYSKFDRKNYFYPDLPKGYQISQYDMPICGEGFLEIKNKIVKIRRIHLEEDTGRLVHKKDYSLVDFNRCGVPLMELVTEPDLNSAEEARAFAEDLHLIMHYLDVSDADMEKGQMRVEVNISLRPPECQRKEKKRTSLRPPECQRKEKKRTSLRPESETGAKLGTKVEIKNLNSFRSVGKAVEYEIERQAKVLKSGKKIVQETRGWDDVKEITVSQREKEEAHDYRYFPEPDLPHLHFSRTEFLQSKNEGKEENLFSSPGFIQKIKSEIPELPQLKKERFKREYGGLTDNEIEIFVYDKEFGQYFEKVVSELEPNLCREELLNLIKLSANYLITDLKGLLKGMSVADEKFLITPEDFAEFIGLIHAGKISSKIAKMALLEMFKTGADPSNIIEEKGLIQITDEEEIEKIVEEVIKKNPKPIEDYKKGKESVLQFLIGQVMSRTQGKAEPRAVSRLLKKKIS